MAKQASVLGSGNGMRCWKERKRDQRSYRNVPLAFIRHVEPLGRGALLVGMDLGLSPRHVGLAERQQPGPAASLVLQKRAGEAKPRPSLACAFGSRRSSDTALAVCLRLLLL